MCKAIFAIEEALHASDDPKTWLPHPASHMQGRTREFFRVDNLPHLCKEFFDFCTHPRIRGFGEEACGGRVRIGQSDAHIHRGKRDFSTRPADVQERIAREGGYGFHGGYGGQFAPQIHTTGSNGLTHCAFMKCLTNLTDLDCPEDGGTSVIAGSHKVHNTVDRQAMVKAALEDPNHHLVHNVVAPRGSTLVFFESLLHSGGSNMTYNGKERVLILASFLPTMYARCCKLCTHYSCTQLHATWLSGWTHVALLLGGGPANVAWRCLLAQVPKLERLQPVHAVRRDAQRGSPEAADREPTVRRRQVGPRHRRAAGAHGLGLGLQRATKVRGQEATTAQRSTYA